MRIDHAARARALVGKRFRAQGRRDSGLDCIGVVLATFEIPASEVPCDYALRGGDAALLRQYLDGFFRRVGKCQLRPGDVMLLAAGEAQLHLAVRTQAGFVHAHAGLRRVVETPGLPRWPLLGVFRRRRSA